MYKSNVAIRDAEADAERKRETISFYLYSYNILPCYLWFPGSGSGLEHDPLPHPWSHNCDFVPVCVGASLTEVVDTSPWHNQRYGEKRLTRRPSLRMMRTWFRWCNRHTMKGGCGSQDFAPGPTNSMKDIAVSPEQKETRFMIPTLQCFHYHNLLSPPNEPLSLAVAWNIKWLCKTHNGPWYTISYLECNWRNLPAFAVVGDVNFLWIQLGFFNSNSGFDTRIASMMEKRKTSMLFPCHASVWKIVYTMFIHSLNHESIHKAVHPSVSSFPQSTARQLHCAYPLTGSRR